MAIWGFRGENAFLSNFFNLIPWDGPIQWNGMKFPTAEHLYQSRKSRNLEEQKKFSEAPFPGVAKRMGSKYGYKGFKIQCPAMDWDQLRLGVMEEVLALKFRPGSSLAKMLLGTGQQLLYEVNWWGDSFWGMVATMEESLDLLEGENPGQLERRGMNHLGRLLMEQRHRLGALYSLRKSLKGAGVEV